MSKPKNLKLALEMRGRYKDDIKVGHTDAAHYWAGAASAYFLANPVTEESIEDYLNRQSREADALALWQSVTVHMPVDTSQRSQQAYRALLYTMSDIFGGATVTDGYGTWVDNNGQLIGEPVKVIQSYYGQVGASNVKRFTNELKRIMQETNQQAVGIKGTNNFYVLPVAGLQNPLPLRLRYGKRIYHKSRNPIATKEIKRELVELYHKAGRQGIKRQYDRIMWAANEFALSHKGWNSFTAYTALRRLLPSNPVKRNNPIQQSQFQKLKKHEPHEWMLHIIGGIIAGVVLELALAPYLRRLIEGNSE